MHGIIATLLASSLAAGVPPAPDESFGDALLRVVSDLDSGFVCPQFLGSSEAREREVRHFSQSLAAIGVTYEDALEIRNRLLTRHNCLPRSKDIA